MDNLVATLARQQDVLLIPAPALTEVLAGAGAAGPEWLRLHDGRKQVRVVAFDKRHAVECAALVAKRQSRPSDAPPGWRQKAKFDEQIVAIAIVERASTIYSDDAGIARILPKGMELVGIGQLPLPPEAVQPELPGLDSLSAPDQLS